MSECNIQVRFENGEITASCPCGRPVGTVPVGAGISPVTGEPITDGGAYSFQHVDSP